MSANSNEAQGAFWLGSALLAELFVGTVRFGCGGMGRKALLRSAQAYLKTLAKSARDEAIGITNEVKEHWEAATLMSLAGIGTSSMVGESVMRVRFPGFIEKRMVVPVLATIVVIVLTKRMRRKAQKRKAKL